jgi:hypothetical protein|tara:strand:+ start:322 stop:489 length:168 start_codon:yes stop_codon:yes gene_type:complete
MMAVRCVVLGRVHVFQRGCGARLGTLRFGRVERHAALEALGRVVRHGVCLLKRVR